MISYIAVALWPVVIYYIYTKGKLIFGKKEISFNWYIVLALLPMFVMIGFRNVELGADTAGYHQSFLEMINTPLHRAVDKSRMETGYLVFVKLITLVTKSPLVYQLICTFVYFIGILEFAKTLDKKDVFLFICLVCTLGLFFFMFTGIRQCLAMSICLFGYKYCEKRKIIPFILCVLLAFCFHKSALLFSVVYFIVKMKTSWYNILLYAIGLWLATTYLFDIQEWFNEQLDYNYEIEETGTGLIFLAAIVLLTVFSIFMIYNNRKFSEKAQALINVNFITVFFWVLRLQTRVAERPSMYFMFVSCALYAYALNNIKGAKERFIFKGVIIGLTLLLYVYRLSTNFSTLVPYRFY